MLANCNLLECLDEIRDVLKLNDEFLPKAIRIMHGYIKSCQTAY